MRMWQDISKILLPVFIGPTCVCCLPHTATRTVKIFQHLASRHWSFVPKWQIKYVSSGSKLCKIEKKFYLWWVLSFLFSSIFNWWIRPFSPSKEFIHPVHCYFRETNFLALKFSCSPLLLLWFISHDPCTVCLQTKPALETIAQWGHSPVESLLGSSMTLGTLFSWHWEHLSTRGDHLRRKASDREWMLSCSPPKGQFVHYNSFV